MILFLTNEFRPVDGGVATYCYEMTSELNALGYTTVVVAAQQRLDDPAFDARQAFPIHRVPEYPIGLIRHAARYQALLRYYDIYKPQLLWAADWRSGISAAFLATQYRIPLVVTAHGTEVLRAEANSFAKSLARYVYGRARTVLCVSHYTQNLLEALRVNRQKLIVTPLGVNYKQFDIDTNVTHAIIRKHELEGKKVILTLARLTARKGQDVMIKAMPYVLKEVPNALYLIAGRGEDEERLRGLVASLNLQEYVRFAGYVSDDEKSAYYHTCNVYLMLSRQEGVLVEGFGLTLLEAGACERPVIAGRHGGVADAVVHGETGLLVEPENIDDVVAAVTRLLTDEEYASSMGKNARRRIEQNANWTATAQNTIRHITYTHG